MAIVTTDIEVSGDVIHSVTSALKLKFLKDKLLLKYGLSNVEKGKFYPLGDYLSLLTDVRAEMPTSLKGIGRSIFSQAIWPPHLNSLEKVLLAIDVAYHMNHKKNGATMFNPATGAMTEGIGHYRTTKVSDKVFRIEVDNPYPCDFDIGLLEGIGDSFKAAVTVEHEGTFCRNSGMAKCIYKINIR